MTIRPTVLLVDDVEANLIALEAQLGNMGCDLVRAMSGNEALRELLKREFAVMLLDVQMPEMDGYEVATYARENPATREVPIIFVTAMLETEEKVLRGYGTGAVDFLFKPVNPYVLRSKVQVFLDLYTSRRKVADSALSRERMMKDLESFNYSVSHDLRAPLRPLDGFSQALLEEYGEQLDETAQGYVKRIRAAAQRMAQLIEDLLRLSKIRAAELHPQRLDLSALVELIAGDLRSVDPGRCVEIVTEPGLVAEGDPGLLRIALENLLRNAWKFTGKKASARIEFGCTFEGGVQAYFVKDDGVGFDTSYAARICQPFQRFHTTTEFEGTGIGLAIVERIIRHHDGRIWVVSQPDRGATFFFSLHEG